MIQSVRITKSHIITRALEEERERSATYAESLQRPGKEASGIIPIALTTTADIKT